MNEEQEEELEDAIEKLVEEGLLIKHWDDTLGETVYEVSETRAGLSYGRCM